jgi:Ca2+-binding RTX toxin-like protein
MAKVKYTTIAEVNPDIEVNYATGSFGLLESRKGIAVYVDGETGFKVSFLGDGLKYTEESGLVKGTLEQIRFSTPEDGTFASITDLNLKGVRKLEDILVGDGVSGLLAKVLQHNDEIIGTASIDVLAGEGGNDVIKAKGGNDLIIGNDGNDRMSGGAGDDVFDFFANSGRDVITDFNVGDGEHFDLLYIREVDFEFAKGAHNFLKLEFSDGASVLLEGVKYSERMDVHMDVIP